MPDIDDLDSEPSVIDLVDDAYITDADAPAGLVRQALAARWAWILNQGAQGTRNAFVVDV